MPITIWRIFHFGGPQHRLLSEEYSSSVAVVVAKATLASTSFRLRPLRQL